MHALGLLLLVSTLPGDAVTTLRLVDLDGDGRLDRLATSSEGALVIALQRAGREFLEVDLGLPAHTLCDVLVGDLNDDSYPDLYLVNRGSNLALLGDGADHFSDGTVQLGLADLGDGICARLTDIDQDGHMDLLLSNLDRDVIFWGEVQGGFVRDFNSPPATLAPSFSAMIGNEAPASLPPGVTTKSNTLNSVPGGGQAVPLGGFSQAGMASGFCADSLRDQATGSCGLMASSVPTLGMLYPMSSEFFVDGASGNVGIGNLQPSERLDVTGLISTSDGVRFGDGTVQATAQVAGPQGPQGAQGNQGPQGPEGPPGSLDPPFLHNSIGTFKIDNLCGAGVPIYGFEWEFANAGSFEVKIQKDFDACSPLLIRECNQASFLQEAYIEVDYLRVTLKHVLIVAVAIEELEGAYPRESVRMTWNEATWEYNGPGGPTSATWNLATNTGGVTPQVNQTPHFAWIDNGVMGTLPPGVSEVIGIGFDKEAQGSSMPPDFAPLLIRKPIDALTTQMPFLALGTSSHPMQGLDADLYTPIQMGGPFEPYMRYRLEGVAPQRISFRVDSIGRLIEEVTFTYEIIHWIYHPNQPDQVSTFWNLLTNSGG